MKVGDSHLTYSMLVHPGDTWEEVWSSVTTYAPEVKRRVSPDSPFGLCLRLSADAAQTLGNDNAAQTRLADFLAEEDLYVYTVNAFVYGPFKQGAVKEQVYEPDWRTTQRVSYTKTVADLVARLAPVDVAPTIQTSPLGFKSRAADPTVVASYVENVLDVVSHLIALRRRTGREVKLALEPEPLCVLETTTETIDFFVQHLYSGSAARRLAELAHLPLSQAHAGLRQHLGIVFDVCHQSIEYEDIADSLTALDDAGVPVFKLQQAAAVRIPQVTPESVDALGAYVNTPYLTQTIEQRAGGEIIRYAHLEDAIAAWRADPSEVREWRVHFHVPVFLDRLDAFQSTRNAITDSLRVHRAQSVTDHLEIETYTWDVLPARLKQGSIVDYVCRELDWVKGELVTQTPADQTNRSVM